MKNWKTILSGAAGLLAAGASVANGHAIDAQTLALLASSVGLLFSKQHNVTGGSVEQ